MCDGWGLRPPASFRVTGSARCACGVAAHRLRSRRPGDRHSIVSVWIWGLLLAVALTCGCETAEERGARENAELDAKLAKRRKREAKADARRQEVADDLGSTPSKTAVNHVAPSYLSTSTSSPDFLRIAPTSFQYTAGSGGKPVGARY